MMGDNSHAETSDSLAKTMEIKIKTLDSRVYTCNVDQNIPVPALKELIATLTGVPAESQRLICRGKVLKDDHDLSAYNVEDGHTLHLVTRQVPPPGAPSSSGGTSAGVEEQGEEDPSPAATRNRPAQISHSVVMGTFNLPDNGDGGFPDVNRIISSVLTSLGIANLVPTNGGANVGGPIGAMVNPAAPVPAVAGQEAGAGGSRPQPASNAGHQPQSSELGGSQAARPAAGPGTLPALGQQFRILQQVIPDTLTTVSQYLDRLEQVLLSTNGQQASIPVARPVNTAPSQPFGSPAAVRGHPTPAILGAMIQRTMGFINGQAGVELDRLSSQLENEPNLTDVGVRGELQSSALRDGVLLQHLGALLLELGRATLTLRMGTSPMESVVNAGPAVFISSAGPNPMMVQPLPFQPGAGFGTGTHQNAGAMGTGPSEVPRNISIHIHANDTATISGPPFQVAVPVQGGVPSNFPSQVSPAVTTMGLGSGVASTSIAGNIAPSVHAIPVPMQASSPSALSEHPGVRVVPMRTVLAAVPSTLHGRPPADITGAPSGLLYPLLARFQQLNSQQVGGSPAAVVHGIPPGPPVVPPSASMPLQSSNSIAPTIRAQVQVQAWVPDGQGGSRLVNNEEALRTLFTSTTQGAASLNSQQQPLSNNRAVSQSNFLGETSAMIMDAVANPPADGQQVPNNAREAPIDSGLKQAQEVERSVCNQAELENGNSIKGKDQVTQAGSTDDKLQPKDRNMTNIPAGLGLRGLQALPPRTPKRWVRQQPSPQAASTSELAVQDQSTLSVHEQEGLVPPPTGGQRNVQGSSLILDSSGTVPNQISAVQQLNHDPLPRGGRNNIDVGNLVPQFMANSGGSSLSARARDIDQGLGLPAGALGSLMGQVMQNPLMRNAVQQVAEETLDHEDLMDQSASSQGGLDFSGLLQQMMPIVSQALSRVSATSSSEQASSRNRENVVRGSTERVREGMNGFQDMPSHGLDASSGSNLSTIFQQMMPVVAQVFGGALGGRPEQASPNVPFNLHASSDVSGARGTADTIAHQLQEEIPQRCETSQLEAEQESTSSERPESAPVAKRQKIDMERAVEKLEQGSSPDEILRVIVETASMLMTPNDNQEMNTSFLAEHLCQDGCLVDDYMALLLRDLTPRNRADC